MKSVWLPCILFLTLAPAIGFASSVKGQLFGDYYTPTDSKLNSPTQAAETLWIQADTGEAEAGVKGFLSGSFTQINDSNIPGYRRDRSILKLDEGYVEYVDKGFQVRMGKKVILWGRADTLNPTDFHTGVDLSILNSEFSFMRNAGTGVELILRPFRDQLYCRKKVKKQCLEWEEVDAHSSWTFDAVFTPIPATSKILSGYLPVPSGVTVLDQKTPEISLDNSEASLKVGYGGNQWDFSVSGFNGFEHHPLFFETNRVIVGLNPIVQVTPKYYSIAAVGADGSFNTQGFVFNAEASVVQPYSTAAGLQVIPPKHFNGVLGVDREIFENFHVTLQGILYYYPDVDERAKLADPITEAIKRINYQLARSQKQYQYGSTLHLLFDDPDVRSRFDIFGSYFFNTEDGYFQPKYTFKWTGSLHTSIGAQIFYGPTSSTYGAIRDISSGFLEIKYFF